MSIGLKTGPGGQAKTTQATGTLGTAAKAEIDFNLGQAAGARRYTLKDVDRKKLKMYLKAYADMPFNLMDWTGMFDIVLSQKAIDRKEKEALRYSNHGRLQLAEQQRKRIAIVAGIVMVLVAIGACYFVSHMR